jgi:hypothetical protein
MSSPIDYIFNQQIAISKVMSVSTPSTGEAGSNITFHTGPCEILKITEDGFYVRGQKVPVDDKEAEAVYKAFKQFLVHHALTKEY